MALILEGCDLAGKTTIKDALNWPKANTGHITGLKKFIPHIMTLNTGFHVWDRWWPSEFIYNTLFRKEDSLLPAHMLQFLLLANVKGAVMAYFQITQDELKRRYEQRGDNTYSYEDCKDIYFAYHAFMTNFMKYLPLCTVNDLESALLLHAFYQKKANEIKKIRIDSWGTLEEGRLLFIGYKINPKTKARYPFQFFSGAGCGQFFFECLLKTNIHPSAIHIANMQYKSEKPCEVLKLIEFLKPTKIIALGFTVATDLNHLQIEHSTIAHPSYWKRFQYKETEKYVSLLEGAINDSKKT